ncbi:ras-related protein Rab-28-like [Copidosoma floridanum]|uniref:ras-related protein Rab-28-like n=1 Tax=Copidosoma floridanum TaxID=29053 RepID=UPI0006C9D8CC|nr:ras-related protein Rab-28-like [Copidosoma floridanum]
MSDQEDDYAERRLKIVLVGDSGAGKTSIAVKFCHNEFSRQYTPTAGIDFYMRNLPIGVYKNVNLYLWDVSGLSLRSSMLDKYIFDANMNFVMSQKRVIYLRVKMKKYLFKV